MFLLNALASLFLLTPAQAQFLQAGTQHEFKNSSLYSVKGTPNDQSNYFVTRDNKVMINIRNDDGSYKAYSFNPDGTVFKTLDSKGDKSMGENRAIEELDNGDLLIPAGPEMVLVDNTLKEKLRLPIAANNNCSLLGSSAKNIFIGCMDKIISIDRATNQKTETPFNEPFGKIQKIPGSSLLWFIGKDKNYNNHRIYLLDEDSKTTFSVMNLGGLTQANFISYDETTGVAFIAVTNSRPNKFYSMVFSAGGIRMVYQRDFDPQFISVGPRTVMAGPKPLLLFDRSTGYIIRELTPHPAKIAKDLVAPLTAIFINNKWMVGLNNTSDYNYYPARRFVSFNEDGEVLDENELAYPKTFGRLAQAYDSTHFFSYGDGSYTTLQIFDADLKLVFNAMPIQYNQYTLNFLKPPTVATSGTTTSPSPMAGRIIQGSRDNNLKFACIRPDFTSSEQNLSLPSRSRANLATATLISDGSKTQLVAISQDSYRQVQVRFYTSSCP